MDESFEEWNDENSPYRVPEEIDLNQGLKQHHHSIGDVLEANGIPDSPNPMDISALKVCVSKEETNHFLMGSIS